MSYTEFFCRLGGNNLNAGANQNNTEEGTAPFKQYTNGSWGGTSVFTPASGNPQTDGVVAGMWASVYIDGGSPPAVAVYVARVLSVNATTITLSTTAFSGTAPANGANRTCRIGGAWVGPSGTSGFPLTFVSAAMKDANGDSLRVNLKNDQQYNITTNISISSAGLITTEGYHTTPGDGGRAVIDGTSVAGDFITDSGASKRYRYLVIQNAATGLGLNVTGGSSIVDAVVVNGCRSGIASGFSTGNFAVECEVYNCSRFGYDFAGLCLRCYAHNCGAGNNGDSGFYASGPLFLVDCISESNNGNGFYALTGQTMLVVVGCDAYNNAADGFYLWATYNRIESSNACKNGGWGINVIGTTFAITWNCGFGSGADANTSGQISPVSNNTGNVVVNGSVTYTNPTNPYLAPATGNFTIASPQSTYHGKGTFTQTLGGKTGSVAFPPIGAVQPGPGGVVALGAQRTWSAPAPAPLQLVKNTDEFEPFNFDFSLVPEIAQQADLIVSASVTFTGFDVALVVGPVSLGSPLVQVQLSGGTTQIVYSVHCKAILASGYIISLTGQLLCNF